MSHVQAVAVRAAEAWHCRGCSGSYETLGHTQRKTERDASGLPLVLLAHTEELSWRMERERERTAVMLALSPEARHSPLICRV